VPNPVSDACNKIDLAGGSARHCEYSGPRTNRETARNRRDAELEREYCVLLGLCNKERYTSSA
jgi:hypothetical protein